MQPIKTNALPVRVDEIPIYTKRYVLKFNI